jgi:hypothetical protein
MTGMMFVRYEWVQVLHCRMYIPYNCMQIRCGQCAIVGGPCKAADVMIDNPHTPIITPRLS